MTQFIDTDEENNELEHESFGMVRISHRRGETELFGVDYPQQHFMALEVSTGKIERNLSGHWFYPQKLVLEINLSEVQFARLVSSPNTRGVPCTIRHRHVGDFKKMESPPEHMATADTWKKEIKGTARRIGSNLDHVRKLVDEMQYKAPTKAQLKEVAHWLQQTQQAIESDMPFVAGRMEEQVDEGVNNAKAEVDAYIAMQLQELGKKALGEEIKKGGVLLRLGGQSVKLVKGKDSE
jgi:hypothetical protein